MRVDTRIYCEIMSKIIVHVYMIRIICYLEGLLREPKWGHLTNLHKAIKQCEPVLVSSYPAVTWPGNNLEVD